MNARRDALQAINDAVELRRVYELAKLKEAAASIVIHRADKQQIETSPSNAELEDQLKQARVRVTQLQDAAGLQRAAEAAAAEVARTKPAADAAQAELSDLQFQVRRLREDSTATELLNQAARHRGRHRDDIAAQLSTAADAEHDAEVALGVARKEHDAAAAHAREVAEGRGNTSHQALVDAHIDAVVVADAVEPTDSRTQAHLSAALAPLHDAVAVAEADLPAALAALRTRPGAVLAVGDPSDEAPVGRVDAPAVTRRLLRWLLQEPLQPDGNVALGPAVTVTGGFPAPRVGREARIAAARAVAEDMSRQVRTLTDKFQRRVATAGDLRFELKAADAHQRLAELRSALDRALAGLPAAEQRLAPVLDAHAAAAERLRAARAALAQREDLLQQATERVDTLERDHRHRVTRPLDELRDAARRVDLPGWAGRVSVSWPTSGWPRARRSHSSRPTCPHATRSSRCPATRSPS